MFNTFYSFNEYYLLLSSRDIQISLRDSTISPWVLKHPEYYLEQPHHNERMKWAFVNRLYEIRTRNLIECP